MPLRNERDELDWKLKIKHTLLISGKGEHLENGKIRSEWWRCAGGFYAFKKRHKRFKRKREFKCCPTDWIGRLRLTNGSYRRLSNMGLLVVLHGRFEKGKVRPVHFYSSDSEEDEDDSEISPEIDLIFLLIFSMLSAITLNSVSAFLRGESVWLAI